MGTKAKCCSVGTTLSVYYTWEGEAMLNSPDIRLRDSFVSRSTTPVSYHTKISNTKSHKQLEGSSILIECMCSGDATEHFRGPDTTVMVLTSKM